MLRYLPVCSRTVDGYQESASIHMRTNANNLVTTASTTHLPEQKETIHMIQMLRKESCSGEIDDLAHVRTEDCLPDCLTKPSIKADALIKAVETGILNNIDTHPSFRELLKHRAYMHQWIATHVPQAAVVACFMGAPLHQIAGAEQVEDLD